MISAVALAIALLAPSVPYRWYNAEIVGGGFVSGIITHPNARGVVYARTDIGGAYRLDPKSMRWIPLQDWLEKKDWNLYGVESVALDPSDPNRLYIAAGTYTNEWGFNGAILSSRDQGRTFYRSNLPFKNGGNEDGRGMGERLAVDPLDGRIVYFGTRHEGLWRSTDAGRTWSRVESFPIRGRTNRIGLCWVLFDPRGSLQGQPCRTIYVGSTVFPTTLYRSTDAGQTWNPVPGAPSSLMPHHAVMSKSDMVITYGNGPGPNGVTDGAVKRFDTDSGEWTDITPQKPNDTARFGYAGISIDARNPQTMVVTTLNRWNPGDTAFRTTDGGKTWTSLKETAVRDSSVSPYLNWARPEPEFGHWIADIEIDPFNPDRAWYVTGATIWRTENLTAADRGQKTQWVVSAEGLEETALLDLVSPPFGAHVVSAMGDIAGFRHDRFDQSPRGGMWTNPLWNTTDDIDFAGQRSSLFIRVGRGGPGQRGAVSYDGAKSWAPFVSNPPGTQSGGTAAISADGRAIVWAPGGSRPHYSIDRGATWRPCEGLPDQGRVISDKVDPNRFSFYRPQDGSAYFSTNGGKSFSKSASPLPIEARRIVAPFGVPGEVWLPGKDGLYRSRDGGKTYAKLARVDSAEGVGFGRSADGANYPTIYMFGVIGRIAGVFRSVDEGMTWVRINDRDSGFGTMEVIEGDPKVFGRVYLGTNGRGVVVGDPRTRGALR